MKRVSVLIRIKDICPLELIDLCNHLIEDIRDFFYKYDLFNSDNIYSKIFDCICSNTYMSYDKISEHALINTKSVIKINKKIESFILKMLDIPQYKPLKNLFIQ